MTVRNGTVLLNDLPEELLLAILGFLDVQPPSIVYERDEPSLESLESETKPLKNLSTVSNKWRRLVLPLLFKYVRLRIWNNALNCLHIFAALDGERPLLPTVLDVFEFVESYNLKELATSLVVYTSLELPLNTQKRLVRYDHVVTLWDKIFQHFSPRRLVIIAPPSSLAELTGCYTDISDAWAFSIHYQRIELRTKRCDIPNFPISMHESVFDMRYWDYLSYNEGSSLDIYGTYQYFLKCPPCILAFGSVPIIALAPWLSTFSYTGVFPHSVHFRSIIEMIMQMKALDCLQLQLAPGHGSNVLEERMRNTGTGLQDCWHEIETSYATIFRSVINRLIKLRSIQVHDCAISSFKEDLLQRLKLINRPNALSEWHLSDDTWRRGSQCRDRVRGD